MLDNLSFLLFIFLFVFYGKLRPMETTLGAHFSLSSPLKTAFMLSSPHLTSRYLSPVQKEPFRKVETVSGWRKQAKAEEDAGLSREQKYKVLINLFQCDLCSICIGPDYYEQRLYLYPVYKVRECVVDTPTTFKESRWLHICGGCAARRHLSTLYLMVTEEYWLTNVLLLEQGKEENLRPIDATNEVEMLRIRRALREHMLAFYRWHLFLLCLSSLVPLDLVFVKREEKKGKTTTSKKKSPLSFTNPLTPKPKPVQEQRESIAL